VDEVASALAEKVYTIGGIAAGKRRPEGDGRSFEADNPCMPGATACWEGHSRRERPAGAEAQEWVAAHGALRADDGSSCPGTEESRLDKFSHALPRWEPYEG
jgi:hypothetical protein